MEYRSWISDSRRWRRLVFRPGDVVISTPPKCGTTWTQVLCALLIFDGAQLERYAKLTATLASPELALWANSGRGCGTVPGSENGDTWRGR
jgi:Sulfotransferase domain